jgi:hypothetical protein
MESENNNIINLPGSTLIFNGGNPMPGCPENWEEAKVVLEKLNDDLDEEGPLWKFDCGFKLDFDGGIIKVSSRFYPPKSHYGPNWDGSCKIFLLDKMIASKQFNCVSLDELKLQVEAYVKEFTDRLENLLK